MSHARIGFVIGHQLREIRLLHPDRITGGGSGLMRFGWVAEKVNADASIPLTYELYRPWRKYDVLVFMKAMDSRCQALAKRQQRCGGKVVFDANVNFYEEFGSYHFEGMRTGPQLKEQAEFMTRNADAVIADSPYLAEVCTRYNENVEWIPDNVDMKRVPPYRAWRSGRDRIPVLWSGQSHKLFEFLAIEETLRKHRDRLELVLVTNDLSGIERCHPDIRGRLQRLLDDMAHRLVPYVSIEHLWSIYTEGGICMAPRFLDSAYNLGHTEWKITLAMACGRVALCHPLSSYIKVSERSGGKGIRICGDTPQWDQALGEVLSPEFAWEEEECSARAVVEKAYDTALIARQHAGFILRTLG